jgi:hypothetical protein
MRGAIERTVKERRLVKELYRGKSFSSERIKRLYEGCGSAETANLKGQLTGPSSRCIRDLEGPVGKRQLKCTNII